MDKLEILLDMIEHPERYTEQQINELLTDEEMRKHFDVMVRLRGAYDVMKVKSERMKSENNYLPKESNTVHEGNSLFSFSTFHFSYKKIAAIFLAAAFLGGLAWALVPHLRSQRTAEPSQPTKESAPSLTGRAGGESVLFADIRLDSMLTVVAAHYGKAVFFGNEDLKGLRIHTKWNPKDSLEAFMESLNELDGLKLTEQRDTIFVQKGGVQ